MVFTQAMNGSYQTALDQANVLIDAIQNEYVLICDDKSMQSLPAFELLVKQERAVVVRLMDKKVEVLREFFYILAYAESYHCLIQIS